MFGSTRPRNLVAVAAGAAAIGLAGCGGSDSGSSKPAYCQDVDALQQSLNALTDIKIQAGALSDIQAKLTQVQQDAQALKASAKSEFAPQTTALKDALSKLSTDAKQTAASPSAAAVGAVVDDVQQVGTAFGDLQSAVKGKC